MDLCQFKNSELEKVFQKYKGRRVILKGDTVKDDGVFTDVISRLPGCSGLASDAVSAYTHVQMKGVPELLHLSDEAALGLN